MWPCRHYRIALNCRYEKVEQQKQGMKKAAELERRFAKKDGAAPDGAAADGAAASSDSDSDQDDEDKITETEEAGMNRMCSLHKISTG